MSFRNLLQKFGAWATVQKWNEPVLYRLRLKGDWIARLAVALGIGFLATTLLLVLFAINRNPPNPLFAFAGMATVGFLVWMNLSAGKKMAGGSVRICEEGIIRKRMYVGLSSQWSEEWSWPYSQISQCAIIPGMAINKPFSVLLLTDGSDVELFGIPERIDLEQTAQFLESKGVVVRRDVSLPPHFTSPMSMPVGIVVGTIGFLAFLAGAGFYAMKAGNREQVAGRERPVIARPVDPVPHGAMDAPQPDLNPVPEPAVTNKDPQPVPIPALSPLEAVAGATNPPPPSIPSLPQIPAADPARPAASNTAAPPGDSSPPSVPAETSSGTTQKTDLVGGPGGFAFEMNTPEQQPILGFHWAMGNWAGTSAVSKLDPITNSDARRTENSVIARDGFVVGGIQVDAENLVEAVRVIFVKRNADGTLDKNDFYFSDWIGEPTGRAVKTLGKGTVKVVGVYGRKGIVIDAVGLVLAGG